jgi:hypothetical protein
MSMSALVLLGMGVIGWVVNKGFDSNRETLTGVAREISGLRTELKDEREDRLVSYGQIMAAQASHKAVCDERHGGLRKRTPMNDGSEQ